jgi:hypothetical protein
VEIHVCYRFSGPEWRHDEARTQERIGNGREKEKPCSGIILTHGGIILPDFGVFVSPARGIAQMFKVAKRNAEVS